MHIYILVSIHSYEECDHRIVSSCGGVLEHLPGVAPVGPHFFVQSAVAPIAGAKELLAEQDETVGFHDAAPHEMGGYAARIDDGSSTDQTQNIDLVRFLSRPVKILEFTWSESDAIGLETVINPWQAFFTDPRVQYKLNNFAFIQCDLKLKILINASPFYYGAMYVGYQPLPAFTASTIQTAASNQHLMLYSQRPHVWLYPQSNQGAEMVLPFFYPKNWINAQSSTDMLNMGQLKLVPYTILQSANGAVGTGVSVAIYAWAENVKLSGPSVGLATQCKEWDVQSDEYGTGPVSSVASAVASAASYFRSIPVIGRFATATQIGASATSRIAKLFGFTNVPVISDTMPFRPEPFPKMASTEIGHPVEKLTLDAKNELTVDPCAIGLKSEDEMAISYLAQKESYLCSGLWQTSTPVDGILFSSAVSPMLQTTILNATNSVVYQTPMAWISSMFLHWRGDIIFKFKVVASKYHKGRLRISYDPSGYLAENIYSDANSSNVVFTEIIDLGETNEVEFRVPYQQAYPFLMNETYDVNGQLWATASVPTFNYVPTRHNGLITVRVQTLLTAPIAASQVDVMVFVRAADNFEVANPRDVGTTPSLFQVQSSEENSVTAIIGTSTPNVNEQRNLVHFGERVMSVRQILRRYSMVNVDYVAAPASADFLVVYQKTFTKMPPMYGYDPHGLNSAKGLVVPGSNFPFNFTQPHPLNWFSPAFVARRGSINWTFNTDFTQPQAHLRVIRTPDLLHTNPGPLSVTNQVGSGATASSISAGALACIPGAGGSALVSQYTNAGLNVQCPMYTFTRFQSTNPSYTMNPSSQDGGDGDTYVLEVASDVVSKPSNGGLLWTYAAAGTDFGLHFFLNVPTWILYDTVVPN